MAFIIKPPLPPMETRSADEIPVGGNWQYEPKWDGFRCLAFRDEDNVYLQSKSGQPLARYFPDVVEALKKLPAKKFVIDGELAIPVNGALSFDELQLRLHPAASRVAKLAKVHPAIFIAFDLLALDRPASAKLPVRHGSTAGQRSLLQRTLTERRNFLEKFAKQNFKASKAIRLSPATTDLEQAKKWFDKAGGDLDGVIAKRLNMPYRSGERDSAFKIKQIRSADCVIGGFRYASDSKILGSLLLGLYDDAGLLDHVGFTSALKTEERRALTKKFERLRKPPGFTGNAPGGPSRWSSERSGEWEPIDPKIVVEVAYDHFTGGRFRHGTKILRWRKDKSPKQCTMDQVSGREGKSLALL
jgi:ATP-dependent DNA ligase